MNNRYLFRAKKTDGEWVEGFYSQLPIPSLGATIVAGDDLCAEDTADYIIVNIFKQHSNFSSGFPLEIVECEQHEVDPETICQYTGLSDKNGRKIFEGDILDAVDYTTRKGVVKFGLYKQPDMSNDYECGNQGFYVCFEERGHLRPDIYYWHGTSNVIGNIFDNPELLKEVCPC